MGTAVGRDVATLRVTVSRHWMEFGIKPEKSNVKALR